MTTAIKRRRGTTTQHSTFTGLEGEITVDSTKDTVVVHDGSTAGGFALLREDLSNNTNVITTTNTKTLTNKTFSDNPVFSAGTANGVAYLNGSKVLTTGSALTFNGTTFGLSGNQTVSGADGLFVSGAVSGSSPFIAGGNLELGAAASSALIQAYNRPSFGAYNLDLKTTTAFTFSLAGSEQMRLTSTGLGIGTSSPAYKLHVSGESLVTGKSYIGASSVYLDYSSGGLTFATANTVKATLDSSGNLGLGVTPSAWNTFKAFEIGNTGSGFWSSAVGDLRSSANTYYNSGYKYAGSNLATMYQQASGIHSWYTAPSGTAGNAISFTTAMTLDASGNLLVGCTSDSTAPATGFTFNPQTSGAYAAIGHTTSAGSGSYFISFGYNGGVIGTITQNGTTAVAYNTSSDYRLKENIQPMQNALDVVAQLKPCTYTWKADGSDGQGFIAHELQAVVPDCVTGEKDAVDEDGKPVYQGIDTSFLVGILTKAIQELKAELDATKAEVAALKAIN